jgi:hypothetical protein
MEDNTFVICDKSFVTFGDAFRHLCGGSNNTYFGPVIMDIYTMVIINISMSCSCYCHVSNGDFWCMRGHKRTAIMICVDIMVMAVCFAVYDYYLKGIISLNNMLYEWLVMLPLDCLYHTEEFIK